EGQFPGGWDNLDAAVPGTVQHAHSERAAEKEPFSANSGNGGKIPMSVGERMASIRRRSVGAGLRTSVDRGEMTYAVAQQLQAVMDTAKNDHQQHLCDSVDLREHMEGLDQCFSEGREETHQENQDMREEMRNLSMTVAALTASMQARNSCPASPNQPVVQQEQGRALPVTQAFSLTPDGPTTMVYTRPQTVGYEEFRTPAPSGCPAGPVSGYQGAIVGGDPHPHGPMRMPAARGATHTPYPERMEGDEWVSGDSRDAFRTPHANFPVRSHGDVGVTPARAGRSGHHTDVESLREDAPARQVHPQMTDARSERVPAGPVPTDDGYYHQNGESATAGLYPTSLISNGDDPILNVAGQVFTSQYSDLVEGHFSMFHTDWTHHMELERHQHDARKDKLDKLSKQYPKGIPSGLLPEYTARPSDRGPEAMLTSITGRPLNKPTATFALGKDTDVADSVTYMQVIESYMGLNHLDYDHYSVALLAGNTTTQYSNSYFAFTCPFGEKITWRKAVYYFLKATPASLTTSEAQWMMTRIVLTAEQPLPKFINNFLLLRFRAGNHQQLSVVMDCLFRAVGVPMEMMLRTHTRHDPDHHLELYNLLEVLAGAEQERNQYRSAATSERVTQARIDKYAAATSMKLWGTSELPLGASATGLQRVMAAHRYPAEKPPLKPTQPGSQNWPQPRFDDCRGGPQRGQGRRPNPSQTQQPRSNFAPHSHQTYPDDVNGTGTEDVTTDYATEDIEPGEEVVNHQMETPYKQYDDSEAWMQYDADAITFEHEDDYMGYWPAPSSHHVHLIDCAEEPSSDELLPLPDFDWCTEPLEPQLADAMRTTKCHFSEVIEPSVNQAAPALDKHETLLSELGEVDEKALCNARLVPTKF
ncbi:hypothetical protein H4R20_000812, partial [Coemansia guatemalensis]